MLRTEVLNAVTRLEVESSGSDPDLNAHLGTVVHCDGVRVQLLHLLQWSRLRYSNDISVFAMLVDAQLAPVVAAFTQIRHNGQPVAVTFVHGDDQAV